MDKISFFRITKTGLNNFTRNWVLTIAGILVMTITLVIFAVLILVFNFSSYSIKTVEERVDISVYMKKGLAEERILDIKRGLEQNTEIKEVKYVSAEEALKTFKAKHNDNNQVISALNEVDENPLLATLRVKARSLEDFSKVSEKITNSEYSTFIEKINYNDNRQIIDKLAKILKLTISVGFSLMAIFTVIAVLVMFNTLRLTIYNRKEELEIMRLVGATDWYVRGPFLFEGIMYSISAVVITAFLILPIYLKVLPKITLFFGFETGGLGIISFWALVFCLFAVGLFLSVISTYIAVRKYLKV